MHGPSKTELKKLENFRKAKERKRLERPPPEYPEPRPLYRKRITVENFDHGYEKMVLHLYDSGRIDSYTVECDGVVLSWRTGMARVWDFVLERFKRVSAQWD